MFVGTDTTTQGNWKGVYGQDGSNVILDTASLPAYAALTPSGKFDYTWNVGPTDVRATQRAGNDTAGNTRIAACWFSWGSFDMTLTLTDGLPHRVALYCLDWDTFDRVQTVEVRDTATGALLDSRSVSSFNAGKYLVWDLIGNVTLRVIKTGGAKAVVSGLFFSTPSASAAYTQLTDSDGEGLPDYYEDRNGNGLTDTGETKFLDADSDYDGRSDAEERAEGTDPLNASSAAPRAPGLLAIQRRDVRGRTRPTPVYAVWRRA